MFGMTMICVKIIFEFWVLILKSLLFFLPKEYIPAIHKSVTVSAYDKFTNESQSLTQIHTIILLRLGFLSTV